MMEFYCLFIIVFIISKILYILICNLHPKSIQRAQKYLYLHCILNCKYTIRLVQNVRLYLVDAARSYT